mmetsp:Transcript_24945/g.47818  ORF Transcript_24945/g.47818 Transcript_24945/m.47818 type:complete len:95 (+) Transcript_24945:510-794(+)
MWLDRERELRTITYLWVDTLHAKISVCFRYGKDGKIYMHWFKLKLSNMAIGDSARVPVGWVAVLYLQQLRNRHQGNNDFDWWFHCCNNSNNRLF